MFAASVVVPDPAVVMLLIGVHLPFGAPANTIVIEKIGIVLAVQVAADATVIRTIVVPSLMRPLGRFNWPAPKPLARFHLRLDLDRARAGLDS